MNAEMTMEMHPEQLKSQALFKALKKLAPGALFTLAGTKIKWQDENIKQPDEQLLAEQTEIELAELKKAQALEKLSAYIYQYYPAEKQAHDDKWASNYSAKLKAAGVKDLEALVQQTINQAPIKPIEEQIQAVVNRLAKKTLNKIPTINGDPKAYANQMLSKLVKIAMRNDWVERCVAEAEVAIKEGREAKLPEFVQIA